MLGNFAYACGAYGSPVFKLAPYLTGAEEEIGVAVNLRIKVEEDYKAGVECFPREGPVPWVVWA